MVKYKFPDRSSGTIIYNEGYTTLVIIDQVAEVDPANADQVALAEMHGGQLITDEKPVVSVVEKKPARKKKES